MGLSRRKVKEVMPRVLAAVNTVRSVIGRGRAEALLEWCVVVGDIRMSVDPFSLLPIDSSSK
jgi:hypothetical protein